MVILVHVSQQFQNLNIYLRYICDYSATGVQLFFTISAISLCISYNKRNENKVRYFFIRRFFRIAPLYYIAILFYNNFFNINILNYNNSIVGIISNFFFIHGFVAEGWNIVPGGWSIATEMTFYFFFPLLYILINKNYLFIVYKIFILILFYFILYILVWKVGLLNSKISEIFHWTIIQFIVFEVAMLFYLKRNIYLTNFYINFISFIILLIISIIAWNEITSIKILNLYPTKLLFITITSILFLEILKRSKIITEVNYLLTKIGKYSYSMYVSHPLLMYLINRDHLNLSDNNLDMLTYNFVILFSTFCFSFFLYNFIEKKGIDIGKILIKKI
jgi:peptidoglycan/LPS O-acetylase OafA/YrhL